MGPGPGGFGPPVHSAAEKNREPLPKSIREIPGYIKKVCSGFFLRLFYIVRLVWETSPWILILMMVVAILDGVLPVAGAYIGAELLNRLAQTLVGAVPFSSIIFLLVLQFIYLFVHRISGDVNTMLTRLSGEMVTNHIRVKIMIKAKDLDLSCFDLPDFYEKLENANREAGMRPVQIIRSTFSIISTLISIISFIVVLCSISAWAPVLIAALALPSAVANFYYRRKNVEYMRHRSKARRQMNYYSELQVNKDMVKEVRLFGLSDHFRESYNRVFKQYFAGLKKLILQEGMWTIGFGALRILATCALFGFVAWRVWQGDMQIGNYSLYTGALNSIASGVAVLVSGTATIYEGTLFIDNLISFMQQDKRILPLAEKPVLPQTHTGHEIRLCHVSFRYPGTERKVLDDINLTIHSGETVVLVGLNGAGKTTLIKLITRLYDPDEGQILLDGRDIREYDVEALYRLFGIIFQDFGKYAVTAGENISYGDISTAPDENRIREAARESGAAEFVEKLARGYQTPLMRFFEEDGMELSIGQWQKLAVSRAFYGDADILILDEPTASLDAIAEQEIFNEFDRLRKDKTTLFVSHRLSSATIADRILVLESGKICEEGTHRELMQQQGKYWKLFTTQAERYYAGEENGIT